jgi:hypothetical protein
MYWAEIYFLQLVIPPSNTSVPHEQMLKDSVIVLSAFFNMYLWFANISFQSGPPEPTWPKYITKSEYYLTPSYLLCYSVTHSKTIVKISQVVFYTNLSKSDFLYLYLKKLIILT